jgi:hypothetical protein
MQCRCHSRPHNRSLHARHPQQMVLLTSRCSAWGEGQGLELAVEVAAASATRAGCYQELEARGSFVSQQVLCAVHFLQCRSKTPSWAVEAPHVGSALVVELFGWAAAPLQWAFEQGIV